MELPQQPLATPPGYISKKPVHPYEARILEEKVTKLEQSSQILCMNIHCKKSTEHIAHLAMDIADDLSDLHVIVHAVKDALPAIKNKIAKALHSLKIAEDYLEQAITLSPDLKKQMSDVISMSKSVTPSNFEQHLHLPTTNSTKQIVISLAPADQQEDAHVYYNHLTAIRKRTQMTLLLAPDISDIHPIPFPVIQDESEA